MKTKFDIEKINESKKINFGLSTHYNNDVEAQKIIDLIANFSKQLDRCVKKPISVAEIEAIKKHHGVSVILVKPIEGYEDSYTIDNIGRIYSHVSNKYLNPYKTDQGYFAVGLRKEKGGEQKKYYVHHLLAKSFKENPKIYPAVNHINGIKTDNRLCNLEWITHSDNIKHAWGTGLKKRKYDDAKYQNIIDLYCLGKTDKEISEITNVSISHVTKFLNGRTNIFPHLNLTKRDRWLSKAMISPDILAEWNKEFEKNRINNLV
jgi:hypothetical protein